MEYPIVVKLSQSYRHGSEEVSELVIQKEPLAEAFFDMPMDSVTVGSLAPVASKVFGFPVSFIRKLRLVDYQAAVSALTPFLAESPETGT